ncbi:MAG TPA: hypothetical protein VF637_16500 [Sphingomicrobium sp.]
METLGFVDVRVGHQQWAEGFGAGRAPLWSEPTMMRATQAFLERLEAVGLKASDWRDHYERVALAGPIPNPLVCRLPLAPTNGRRPRKTDIPIDLSDPKVKTLHDRVVKLNDFLKGHVIAPLIHPGFRRIFSNGGQPGYAWNEGGRLYSIGDENYQMAPEAERLKMTIDGEPVVELDIRASYLTILHALRGEPFDPSLNDPYTIEGLPRGVVKTWVAMTLGHNKFHRRWTKKAKTKYTEKTGRSLQDDYPIGQTTRLILSHLPIIQGWPESVIRWGYLQYIESEAIIQAMETLAFEHEVPSLPVHDSLIVPVSKRVIAKVVLEDSFRKNVGVSPFITEDG